MKGGIDNVLRFGEETSANEATSRASLLTYKVPVCSRHRDVCVLMIEVVLLSVVIKGNT